MTGTINAAGATRPVSSPAQGVSGQELLPPIASHLGFLFDERPLLHDEDPTQYDALLHSLISQVKPADVIEAIWVKDITDLVWEAQRLRRWRGRILGQARWTAAADLIEPVIANNEKFFLNEIDANRIEAETLSLSMLNGHVDDTGEVEELLKKRNLTLADVTARAFQLKIDDIERIEHLIASADRRRDALLREIGLSRSRLGQQLRAAATDVIDVDASGGNSDFSAITGR